MVPGGATEQTASSTRDVAPGGRHEPRVQLITAGVGADWAGLSDRRDRLEISIEGEVLQKYLDEYIWYYAYRTQAFQLEERPAIHLDARVFSDPGKGDLGRHSGRHHELGAKRSSHLGQGIHELGRRPDFAFRRVLPLG